MKDFSSKKSVLRLKKVRVAIVSSRYHETLTTRLVEGATNAIRKEVEKPVIDCFFVSGAYELPQAAQLLAASKKYDAIIPIGCLVRGETAHFEYISQACSLGLDEVGRATNVAVSFGVLTVNTFEQAEERAGGKWGNKGEEAALAALDLVKIKEGLKRGKSK